MKAKKHIYPVEFDPELYARLKEYAKKRGNQSVGSVIRYAVTLFLPPKKNITENNVSDI